MAADTEAVAEELLDGRTCCDALWASSMWPSNTHRRPADDTKEYY